SSLIGATVLLSIPNPKMKAKESEMRIIHQEQYQRQQSGQIFSSEAEIVEYAEQIKTQQKAAPTPENSKYLNDDLSEDKKANQGPDMSGLDDLADL
ncbi:MAG: hypothetical protein JKY54_15805, partial [Flavobacteriales bacterium]|nr:hypothetical protein [Flavobacteriales bacterium]